MPTRTHQGGPAYCEHCNAHLVEHRHSLTRGLAITLWRFFCCLPNGGNPSNVDQLRHVNLANWQKLRYWGFIEPLPERGQWHVTDLGSFWLSGEARVPKHTWTWRGNTVEQEGELVAVGDILSSDDSFWQEDW